MGLDVRGYFSQFGYTFGLMVSSFVVTFSIVQIPVSQRTHASTYGFVLSIVSGLVAFVTVAYEIGLEKALPPALRSITYLSMAAFWIAATLVMTWLGPFDTYPIGNGYIGSWVSVVLALICSAPAAREYISPIAREAGTASMTVATSANKLATNLLDKEKKDGRSGTPSSTGYPEKSDAEAPPPLVSAEPIIE